MPAHNHFPPARIPGLAIGALIAVVIAAAACGGGGDAPLVGAPSGEVRPTVAVDNRAEVVVALEVRGADGEWGATAHPQDREVDERAAGDDWWHSSEIVLEVSAAITLGVADEMFLFNPPAAGLSDDCGILLVGPLGDDDQRSLGISSVGGAACAEWLPPLTVAASGESFEITTRIAVQWSGDCAAVRVEVRDRIDGWRSLPASRVCGLEERVRAAAADGEGLPSRPGVAVIVPLSEDSRAIELRSTANGVSAGIDGRKLSTECGLLLERGFLTIWQHRFDTDTCEWVLLERIAELGDGPIPDDLLDEHSTEPHAPRSATPAPPAPPHPRSQFRHTRARRGYLAEFCTQPPSSTTLRLLPSFLRKQESRRSPALVHGSTSRRPTYAASAPPNVRG